MGDFRLALGGSISVCTPEEMDDKLAGLQGNILRRFQSSGERPIRRKTSGSFSGQIKNGNNQVIVPGISKPGMGRIWAVTRITIIGNDDHTAVTNCAVAAYVGDAATPMQGSVLIPGINVPYFNSFNTKSIWVDDSEEIFFIAYALGADLNSQNIVVNLEVSEFFDHDVDQQHA